MIPPQDGPQDRERTGTGITGTPDTLLEAAEFMRALEKRQGFKIACPEEVAFNLGWIDAGQLRALGHRLEKSTYGRYLLRIADGE